MGNATAQSSLIPTGNVTNGTTYSGQTSFGGYTYKTDALYLSGIASNSTDGVNHEGSVGNANTLPVDGLVAVLTVSIVTKPASTSYVLSTSSQSELSLITHHDNCSGASSLLPAPSWPLAAAMFAAFAISLSA